MRFGAWKRLEWARSKRSEVAAATVGLKVASMPLGRAGEAAVAVDGAAYVAGGRAATTEGATTPRWTTCSSTTWRPTAGRLTARHGLGAGVVGSGLFALLGGPPPSLSATNAAESLDLTVLDGCTS